jgi:hypothetical protein
MYYFVKFERDWADEFSVYGYRIMSVEDFSDFYNYMLQNADVEISLGFGTNEGWDCETVEDYSRCLSIEEISESTAQELISKKLDSFGVFWDLAYIKECVEEALDE